MNSNPMIVLFEENELNIAALYSLYAQNIPSKSAFWNRLSNEEIAHAAKIGGEKEQADSMIENKFSSIIIKNVVSFVMEETKKAQQNKIGHREALKTALRIEQSMIEKKCFDIFTPKSQRLKDVFCKLNSDTERHINILVKEMKKNKFSFGDSEK